MEVEYRYHRQAQEGCWDGGEKGVVRCLQQRGKAFFWLLILSLPGVDISDQRWANNVSWSLNPPGNGVCRDPAPVPPA